MIILRNCSLIPELTEEYFAETADILIEDKFIKNIEKPGYRFNVDCVEELDCKGKTVMPGIIDLHCHLGCTASNFLATAIKEPAERVFDVYKYAKACLMTGTTTVRDVGCDNNAAIAVRDAINNNIVDGPRIYASGKIITPTESGNNFFSTMYVEADGVTEIRRACRKEFQNGADFIKIMGSGAVMNPNSVPGIPILEEDELKEAVRVAETRNSYVAAHCHGKESIKRAVLCGVRTIEHGSFIDEEGIELIKNAESYIVPTLFIDKYIMETKNSETEFMQKKMETFFDKEITSLRNAYEHGLKMGWGTDVDMESYIENPGMEFILRHEWLDMSEIDILLQATKYSAEIIKCEDKIGTIKKGKFADLILIDGNPVENIELMNTGIVHVFKDGIRYR